MKIRKLQTKIEDDKIKLDSMKFKPFLDTWFYVFKEFFDTEDAFNIYEYLNFRSKHHTIIPTYNNIYKPFKLCKNNNLKAIIITSEPYSTIGNNGLLHADGVGLSASNSFFYPETLSLFFNSMEEDLNIKVNRYPDLTYLAEQGILIINSTMTCELNNSQAHKKSNVWKPFYNFLFLEIINNYSGLAIVTLGKEAKELSKLVDPRFHEIKHVEDPGLVNIKERGFNHENMFSWINKIIENNNGIEFIIEWDSQSYKEKKIILK